MKFALNSMKAARAILLSKSVKATIDARGNKTNDTSIYIHELIDSLDQAIDFIEKRKMLWEK